MCVLMLLKGQRERVKGKGGKGGRGGGRVHIQMCEKKQTRIRQCKLRQLDKMSSIKAVLTWTQFMYYCCGTGI